MQRVRAAATVLELRTALGQLETAVHEEFLSPQFKRKPAPVKGAWLSAGAHVSSEHAFLMLSETVQCTKRLYRSRQVQFSLHDGNIAGAQARRQGSSSRRRRVERAQRSSRLQQMRRCWSGCRPQLQPSACAWAPLTLRSSIAPACLPPGTPCR